MVVVVSVLRLVVLVVGVVVVVAAVVLLLNLTRKAPWSLAECASSSSASARDISPKYQV